MSDREGIFAGDQPFDIVRRWMAEAETEELNDPNAIATGQGCPSVHPATDYAPECGGFSCHPLCLKRFGLCTRVD